MTIRLTDAAARIAPLIHEPDATVVAAMLHDWLGDQVDYYGFNSVLLDPDLPAGTLAARRYIDTADPLLTQEAFELAQELMVAEHLRSVAAYLATVEGGS